jgi:hypothetical protein
VEMPIDNFWAGMYTKYVKDGPPKEFEIFNFFIDSAPNHAFEIFNIPSDLIFRGALDAGFDQLLYKKQYSNPDFENDPIIRRYLD